MEMGMRQCLMQFVLITALLSFSVMGDYTEYFDNQGVNDGWEAFVADSQHEISQRTIESPVGLPLVGDINGDGVIEIVVAKEYGIHVYYNDKNFGLMLRDAYSDLAIGQINSMILFDIDDDDLDEIIFSTNKYVYILEFNESFTMQSSLLFSNSGKQSVVGCKGTDRCFVAYTDCCGFSSSYKFVDGRTFTSSSISSAYNLQTIYGEGNFYHATCMPNMRKMHIVDVEDNGENDYVFATLDLMPTSGDDKMNIFKVIVNASNDIVGYNHTSVTLWNGIFGGAYTGSCTTGSPSSDMKVSDVLPIDMFGGSELEYVIASQVDSDSFRIYVMNWITGSEVDSYPGIQAGDGKLISNVIRADVMSDTGYTDVCAFGFNDDEGGGLNAEGSVQAICGNSRSGEDFTSTREFYLETEDYENMDFYINYSTGRYFGVIHSAQYSNALVYDNDNTFNPSEFITPYGILEIDPERWYNYPYLQTEDGYLKPIYRPLAGEASVISAITKNVDIADVLYLTSSALFLSDNGLSNLGGYLTGVIINPCIDNGSVKSGENMDVIITAEDDENDRVSSRVTIYSGLTSVLPQEELVMYNWTDDPESDGALDASLNLFGAKDSNEVYDSVILIRDYDNSQDFIDSMSVRVATTTGSPQSGNFVYDIWVCPTSIDSLNTSEDLFYQCDETPELVADDIDLSSALGGTAGIKRIPFDSFYEIPEGYENLAVISKYVSGTLGVSYWQISYDSAPTLSNMLKRQTRTPPSTLTDNTIYAYVPAVSLYNDHLVSVEEVSDWYPYTLVGNPMKHEFESLDYITPNAKMLLEVRDEENPTEIRSEELTFSVAFTGVEYGSCSTSLIFTSPFVEPEPEPDDGLDVEDNAVVDALDAMDELGFRGLGGALKWVFIMTIVVGAVFWTGASKGYTGFQTTSIAVILTMLMTYAGVKLEVLSVGIVIIGVIIAIGLLVGLFRLIFISSGT